MKILYIGVTRDGGGWCNAATDYILALDSVGVDIVSRPIKLNNVNYEPPVRILELEKKSSKGATHCIQHILPEYMVYDANLVCCGLYASETRGLSMTGWIQRLNLMDKVYCINREQAADAIKWGVTRPISIVPHCMDMNKIQRNFNPLGWLKSKLKNSFSFYTIGEAISRKDLASLLKAFHSEFSPWEPVELVIKTSLTGSSSQDVELKTLKAINKVKQGLKLHTDINKYKKEIIITDYLSEEDLWSLHHTCDCFVSASHGEAFDISSQISMSMGKTPIVPNTGGYRDYISNETGWLVNTYEDVVYEDDNTPLYLHNAYETWCNISVPHLRSCMREVFENKKLREKKKEAGISHIYNFSYESVGKQFCQTLKQNSVP